MELVHFVKSWVLLEEFMLLDGILMGFGWDLDGVCDDNGIMLVADLGEDWEENKMYLLGTVLRLYNKAVFNIQI